MMDARFAVAAALIMVTAGCGGGGSAGGSAAGGSTPGAGGSASDKTLAIGNFITRVSGTTQQPVSVAGYGANVVGVAGGTVSSLTLVNPPATAANSAQIAAQTSLLFLRNGQMTTVAAAGGTPNALASTVLPLQGRPCWSPDGSRVAYSQFVPSINKYQIYVMSANGTGPTRVSDGTATDYDPSWGVTNRICFTRYDITANHYQIYSMVSNGTSVVKLTDGATRDDFPVWSPTADRIAFVRQVGALNQVYIMNADGSNAHPLTTGYASTPMSFPSWSPDGNKIAFSASFSSDTDIVLESIDGSYSRTLTSGHSDYVPCWSPDGLTIAFQRYNSSTGNSQICETSSASSAVTAITDGVIGDAYPSWSPYVQSRRLVGSGGMLASAAGFMSGAQGKVVSSVVLFNATTPDSAFISTPAQLVSGQSALALTVTADSLTQLIFTNNFNPLTTVLGGSTTATGATVSFDANDGTVSSVLPFNATKAAAAGGQRDEERKGDELILRRHFTGVWDGKGKNLAPQGAAEVRVSARTGRLLSFR